MGIEPILTPTKMYF